MGNGGFWLFVVIVVANLVITAIKKAAEKKAAAAGKMPPAAKPAAPRRVALSGKGNLEIILERIGDRSFDVMTVLREVAGMSLDAASDACVSPPSVVATNLTRSEAGMIRQALEGAGAGVSIRRVQKSSFEVAVADSVQAVERSVGAIDRTLERAVRSVEQSVGRGVTSGPAKPASVRELPRKSPSPSRVEALRTPPPQIPASRTPRREVVTRSRTSPREAVSPSPEIAIAPIPEIASLATGAPSRSAVASRLAGLVRRKEALRDAFILQELLKPPLSQRPGGVGGRLG